jgi:hypothetical protein
MTLTQLAAQWRRHDPFLGDRTAETFQSGREDAADELEDWLRHHPEAQDHEHVTELNPGGTDKLRAWLARPRGSLSMGRVTFEAVAGGGILVRTRPYTGPETS